MLLLRHGFLVSIYIEKDQQPAATNKPITKLSEKEAKHCSISVPIKTVKSRQPAR